MGDMRIVIHDIDLAAPSSELEKAAESLELATKTVRYVMYRRAKFERDEAAIEAAERDQG
jgi:hypothetical protein